MEFFVRMESSSIVTLAGDAPQKLFPIGYNDSVQDRPKPLHWVGSSKRDLLAMPEDVQQLFGFALYNAQTGGLHPAAKPLRGFGSAGVLEITEDWRGSTYRAVYTVRFRDAVYVLHCFQKKSRRGIETPLRDIELIRERLKQAEATAKEVKG